ncbi:MAG: DegT/DnrJ/EryC1/StrS family aminotransferase [Candidatus Doudnabacteria bacterium]
MRYIPFHKPNIPKKALKKIKEVLDSGWITTGKETVAFENSLSKLLGVNHAVAVSSGTAALHLAYLAAGIGSNDEVIVPSYTFCSTINTILHVGARPVFCDIEEDSLCLDPKDVEKKITAKTKAIVVVHFAGMPANLSAINKIARKHNLKVIEDAAHAFMTKYDHKFIGRGKNLVCFSFYATKNLTSAEGGLVVCPDKKTAEYVRSMSLHGISKSGWKRYSKHGSWRYDVLFPGFKYNLTDVHAAIGLSQTPFAKKSHLKRQKLSSLFRSLLKHNPNLILPKEPTVFGSEHAWHLFVVRIKLSALMKRDEVVEKLKLAGIGTSVHFIPNHLQSYYRKIGMGTKLPVTEKVFSEVLSLPFHEKLKIDEVKYICKTLNKLTHGK